MTVVPAARTGTALRRGIDGGHAATPGVQVRSVLRHSINGAGSVVRAVLRLQYRVARIPLDLVDTAVAEVFADDASARLAYDRLLIGCDRAAAHWLADPTAAARAHRREQRSAPARYALARRHQQLQSDTDLVLARHRARFEQRRHHQDSTSR